jgi:hypothetical protein
MPTLRSLVSSVRSSHKLLSTDTLATDRFIASEIRNATLFLVKRETNLRKLWATDSIFTTIPCLELVEVPISECCGYTDPCTIARSKYPLPRISEGNYQYVIQGVYSINAMGGNGNRLKEISINRYLNLLKLPIIKKEDYFWISNGYLYITNPNLQAVRLVGMFEEDIPNEMMYPECGCGQNVSDEEWCKNPLDKEYSLPGYLEKQVLDLTSQKLLSTYFRLRADVSQNDIDEQAPNGPMQNQQQTQQNR